LVLPVHPIHPAIKRAIKSMFLVLYENTILAFQSLRANPLRSMLTLIGIAVGIAAVLYVVSMGEITKKRINERLESLGSNVLVIRPGFPRHRGVRSSASVVNLKWDDARQISNTSDVITVTVPSYYASATAEYLDNNWNARVQGTTPDYETVNNTVLAAGRFFVQSELTRRARVCLIGANVREELFGDADPVGESIYINKKLFEVIGLLEAVGESWASPDDQIFVPLTTAQERLFGVDYLSTIYAQLESPEDYDEALFDIENILRRNHRLRDDQENDFRVNRQDFFLSTIQETNVELANFIILIALISLVVGGIGIANVMLVSVTERTREIGVRRAVGANRFMIIMQFLTEAVALGLFGGFLGVLAGVVLNSVILGVELILPWVWIFYSFLICVTVGIVAGLYPAYRAAHINVIEALRYE